MAREEIKSIYTRETIKLTSEDGKTVTSWSPVAAFFDWSVRPKFWDRQPIISVEYLPIKRFILLDERSRRPWKSSPARPRPPNPTEPGAQGPARPARDRRQVAIRSVVREREARQGRRPRPWRKLARKVGEETKWLSPEDLETADVTVDGKKTPFVTWLDEADDDRGRGRRPDDAAAEPKLSDLEQKAFDVGVSSSAITGRSATRKGWGWFPSSSCPGR